jgi:hypothetical protein
MIWCGVIHKSFCWKRANIVPISVVEALKDEAEVCSPKCGGLPPVEAGHIHTSLATIRLMDPLPLRCNDRAPSLFPAPVLLRWSLAVLRRLGRPGWPRPAAAWLGNLREQKPCQAMRHARHRLRAQRLPAPWAEHPLTSCQARERTRCQMACQPLALTPAFDRGAARVIPGIDRIVESIHSVVEGAG